MEFYNIIPDGANGKSHDLLLKIIDSARKRRYNICMVNSPVFEKWLEIESQIMMDTDIMVDMLKTILKLAKEAGYTHVKDHWGLNAHDQYTIDEAIEKFDIKPTNTNDELPF